MISSFGSLLLFVMGTAAARAEHANIKLELTAPDGRQETYSDHEPPIGGVLARKEITVKAGDQLVLQFLLTNTYPHRQLDQVIVRDFVVRIADPRAKEVPDLKDAVAQGTVNMNFKPKCRVGTRLLFRLPGPGNYIVRVDTQNTQSDHEHFAAIYVEAK